MKVIGWIVLFFGACTFTLIEWILYLENLSVKSISYDPKDDELYLIRLKCFEKSMEDRRISNAQIDS